MLPINHLKRTLDRCCGQWEFVLNPETQFPTHAFRVLFLNTGVEYTISVLAGKWFAFDHRLDSQCHRLTGILNGHKRNDAGEVEPIFETPDKVAT